MPNGQAVGSPAYQYKLQWLERLCARLRKENDENAVVAGDFNVAPGDLDVHDPDLWRGAIMRSERTSAALADVMGLGLVDSLRQLHPESRAYSWWDYRMLSFPKDRGLRIDLVLVTAPLMKRCVGAGVDRDMRKGKDPSDHAPVWAGV